MVQRRRGALRRKIVIEEVTQSTDSPGGVVQSYSPYATRYMVIEPMVSQGREFDVSDQDFASQQFRFMADYDSALNEPTFNPSMRLAKSNLDSPETFTYYDILSIRNIDERNRIVEIIAVQKAK